MKKLGVRIGNWLTAEQARKLLAASQGESLRNKRDYAALALLLGCGLRRAELVALPSGIFSSAKTTGSLLIWWERADTSGAYPCRNGSRRR